MAQFILPRGVTGFTSITVSLASFWAYSWKLPHRANGGNLRKSWGICVFLFQLWPNLTQPSKKSPLAYPLSTHVYGGRRKR